MRTTLKKSKNKNFKTYRVTVFLGRSVGMWRSPRREQSTTAPDAEHEHGAGQTSAPNVALTATTINDKTTNFSIFNSLIYSSSNCTIIFTTLLFSHFCYNNPSRNQLSQLCYYNLFSCRWINLLELNTISQLFVWHISETLMNNNNFMI